MQANFRRLIGALALGVSALGPALAQQRPLPTEPVQPCATDLMMRQALGVNYDAWMRQYKQELRELTQSMSRPAALGSRIIVPVVVHIIHTDQGNNITEAQVYDAMDILNWTFHAPAPDSAFVVPYFQPRVNTPNFEFRLARLDPQGNATNGITHVYSTLTEVAGENVKGLIRWDQTRYLNLWIVETIASGAGGYSFLPCPGLSNEGVVLRNAQFGSIGTSGGLFSARSLTHEVGHYFGLPHTWGGTNTPGAAGNCNDDDGVADTPNTMGTSGQGCPTNEPSCAGDPDPISNTQNYMNYASCPRMFTTGQATVMRNSLTRSCRQVLTSASNLQTTGVANGQTVAQPAPVAYLWATAAAGKPFVRICVGEQVTFTGAAYNRLPNAPGTVSYQWTFPGGTPATSTDPNPAVTYTTPGSYDATLVVTDPNGSGTYTRPGYVTVLTTTGGLQTPVAYSFENPTFPVDPADANLNWEITTTATSGPSWEAATTGYQSASSVRIRLRNTLGGNNDHELISPNIAIPAPLSRAKLYFRRAYAGRGQSTGDKLTVSYSLDCGRSWITRNGIRVRPALESAPDQTSGIFVPTAAQWKADSIQLPNVLNAGDHVRVRFMVTTATNPPSGGTNTQAGNAIYIDDIRVQGIVTGVADELASLGALSIAPNPAEAAQARVYVTAPSSATLTVYDAAGRRVGQPLTVLPTGNSAREVELQHVTGHLAAGLYLVELRLADGTRRTQRALITN